MAKKKIGGAAWNAGRQQIVRKGKHIREKQHRRKTKRGLKRLGIR